MGRSLISKIKNILITLTFLFTYFLVLPTNSSFSAYDDGGPPIPGNIQNTVIQGTYINDSGNLQWEKLMPDPANSESTNPQYADVYRPGFKHICGATFLLMATQSNWNGTESQQGSQQTVVDNSGGDSDPRCGVFKITRSNTTQAQDFIYRLWEVSAPGGSTALYPVNSYSYSQSATICNGANEVTVNQNPCIGKNDAVPQLSAVVRSNALYYYPNSSWTPSEQINGWNFGAFINYPIPTTVTWEKTDASGNRLAGSAWDMTNSSAGQAIQNIADCTIGNCDGFADKDNRAGYFKINSILADGFGVWTLAEKKAPDGFQITTETKQIYMDLWNTIVSFGTIINEKTPEYPHLIFNKVDTEGEALDGASFTVSNLNMTCTVADNSTGDCENAAGIKVGEVEDINGDSGRYELVLPEVNSWTLTEVASKSGYNFGTQNQWSTSEILMNGIFDLGDIVNYEMPSLHFTKSDIDTGERIGGATFQVSAAGSGSFSVTDCVSRPCPAGNMLDRDPAPGSIVLESLPDHDVDYSVQETAAPENYFLNSTPISAPVIEQPMNEIGDIPNQHLPQLIWEKVDHDNQDVALPDSIWGITDDKISDASIHDCDKHNEWCVTDEIPYNDLDERVGYFRVILEDTDLNIHSFTEKQAPPGYNIDSPAPDGTITFAPGGCATGSQATLGGNLANYFPSSTVTIGEKCTVDLGKFTNKRITPTLEWVKTDSAGWTLPNSVWTLASPDSPKLQNGRQIADYTGQINYHCEGNTPGNEDLCDLDPRPGYFMITDFFNGADTESAQITAAEILAPDKYSLTQNSSNTFSTSCQGGDHTCFFDGNSGLSNDPATAAGGAPAQPYFSASPATQGISNLRLPYLAWDKVCDETGQPLKDSQWTLTDESQNSYSVIDNASSTQAAQLEDLDPALGSFLVQLPHAGNWTLTEAKAPDGYNRATTGYPVHLENENIIYSIPDGRLTPNQNVNDDLFEYSCEGDFSKNQPGALVCGLQNSANAPTIKWTKTDEKQNVISGTQWQIQLIGTDFIGNTGKIYNITDYSDTSKPNACTINIALSQLCDSDPRPGHFVVPGIPEGNYKLIESTTPSGFQVLDPNTLCAVNYSTSYDWCLDQVPNLNNFIRVENAPDGAPAHVGEFYTVRDDAGGKTRIVNTHLPVTAAWDKTDDLNNPIRDSAWEVCNVNDWNPASRTCAAPYTVYDNVMNPNYSGLDQNPAPGGFAIELEPDDYILHEISAPPGFVGPASDSQIINFSIGANQWNWIGEFANTQYPSISWHKMSSGATSSPNDDFDLTGSQFSLSVNPDLCSADSSQTCTGDARQGEPFTQAGAPVQLQGISDCIAADSEECARKAGSLNADIDPRAGYYTVLLPECSMSNAGFPGAPPAALCGADGQSSYYWTLTEASAPAGYDLPSTTFTTNEKLGKHTQNPDTPTVNFAFSNPIYNNPIEPTATFRKIRSDFSCSDSLYNNESDCLNHGGSWQAGLPLGGATFTITNSAGETLTLEDNTGKENYSCTPTGAFLPNICDSDARAGYFFIPALPPGQDTYSITESAAPVNFVLDHLEKTFCASSIESSQCHINNVIADPFSNSPQLGILKWSKSNESGAMLGGSKWSITNSSLGHARAFSVADNTGQADYYSTCVLASAVPDSDLGKGVSVCDSNPAAGLFTVNSLPMDAWNIEETQAPAGYVKLNGRLDTVELTQAETEKQFNSGQPFINQKSPVPPPSPTPTPAPPGPTPNPTPPNPNPNPPNPEPSPDTGLDLQILLILLVLFGISSAAAYKFKPQIQN